jgi:P2-related tail formation protein
MATFSRTDQHNIEITRNDDNAHPEVVVFSRQLSLTKTNIADSMRVIIDDNQPIPRHKHTRQKSTYASYTETTIMMTKLTIIAVLISFSVQFWCQ